MECHTAHSLSPSLSFIYPQVHLNPAVVDEYLQNRDFLSAGIQWRQIIQAGVYRSISPVLKFPGKMSSLLIFYLSPDDVLEHLWRKKHFIHFSLLRHFLSHFPNAVPKAGIRQSHTPILPCLAAIIRGDMLSCWVRSPSCCLGRVWHI